MILIKVSAGFTVLREADEIGSEDTFGITVLTTFENI